MQTVHLAPYESGSFGAGTAHDPLRILGPRHLDEVLAHYSWLDERVDALHIHGHLPCGPNWSAGGHAGWAQIRGGAFSLIGDGMAFSGIYLDPEAPWYQDRPDGSVLWFGPEGGNGGPWTVRDLTIDGNAKALVPLGRYPRGGIRFHGSGITVERVRFTGLAGDYATGLECFPVSALNAPGVARLPYDGGLTLRDIVIDDVQDAAFVSGIVVGYRDFGRAIRPSLVANAQVDLGRGNHLLVSANRDTTFMGVWGRGAKYGLYIDESGNETPCEMQGVDLVQCRMEVEYGAVNLISTKEADFRRQISIRHNRFTLRHAAGTDPAFVRLLGPAPFEDIFVEANHVECEHPRLPLVSTDALSINGVRFADNIIPRGSTRHVVHAEAEDGIAWSGNRDTQGKIVALAKF